MTSEPQRENGDTYDMASMYGVPAEEMAAKFAADFAARKLWVLPKNRRHGVAARIKQSARSIIRRADMFLGRGPGDMIKNITGAAGIEQCGGCGDRQTMLNVRFPWPWR